ncbi:Acyl transferase/acyl hydrolase/lysophospholipase [Penicillium nucicola]|uniref:Acyl transferase/acyl hydrolase/lysophospholipase n=1 Tax=Penicillium nucicola TaxID=1850975 RepID=UPI0025459001|nr:Acyl transferase/acyl hydrolase/lysophospholipase [Penicillium nucicola]KAJ5770265.1 Acyl transferase/acyl hydrolase/lysophospholipase [Penicillium nucicola]
MSTSMCDSLSGTSTPMAICGMALRLPGGISNDAQLWEFLLAKRDARSRVPNTRYNASSYHSKSGNHGTSKSEYGYFLDESVDLGTLDTSFFSFTKLELEYIDPCQRQLLEVVRECFESAGEVNYRGRDIGCFVGSFGDDWTESLTHDHQTSAKYPLMVGGDFAIPNRVSYEYDLHGPSLSIRTACSSSIVALHSACLSIERGDCSAAIVAGFNLILTPTMTMIMTAKGVLSADGSSKSFDADADGYGRGEAVNAVYIKPLKDAIRDGNPIRAVIRGTATNSDGKSAGFTVPSPDAQEDVIRKAYQAAGISNLSQTAFVECHGTGTTVGDPIEVAAVANTFGGDTGLFIGSVKPNVGHSEGASGLTSLIKAVLAVENRTIPPNIKFNTPNPKIAFEAQKITVPVEATPWPQGRCVRASVNSFGMGGVNAHVVIESAENFTPSSSGLIEKQELVPRLLLFSANTQDSLEAMIQQNLTYLTDKPDSLRDLAYTMGARREHLPFRAASIVRDDMSVTTTSFGKTSQNSPDIVMVFAGQGAQWPGMGVELFKSNATFRRSLLEMDSVLQSLPNAPAWSIIDEISKENETSQLYLSSYSQPICTAIQIALVDTLLELNIKPYAVIGHSSGELAAAYAAGRLTASQALILAFYRGIAAGKVTQAGCMAAVGTGRHEIDQFLRPGVVVACENSPSSVTISGDVDQVEQVMQVISSARPEILVRRLKSDTAYHSDHMKPVGDMYHSFIDPVLDSVAKPKHQTAHFFSTVTGDMLSEGDAVGSKYWQTNLESPVLFHGALNNIVTGQKSRQLLFLEVSPHSTLAGPIRQTLDQVQIIHPYVACLVRSKNCAESFLSAVGQLYSHRQPLDFDLLTNPDRNARVLTDVPTYPWQHNYSSLYKPRQNQEWLFRKQPKHEILGTRVVDSTDNEPCWRNVLYLDHVPWLRDHKVSGNIVFPAAGYIMMAGEAVRQIGAVLSGFTVRSMGLDIAMILNESNPTEIVTSLRRHRQDKWYSFTISSHNGVKWIEHCYGEVIQGHGLPSIANTQKQRLSRDINVSGWYKTLRRGGVDFGPSFQGIESQSCSTNSNTVSGKIVSRGNWSTYYPVHPTVLDSAFHLVYGAIYKGLDWQVDSLPVPTSIGELNIGDCASDLDVTLRADVSKKDRILIHGGASGSDGSLSLRMKDMVLRPLGANQAISAESDSKAGARLHWVPILKFLNLADLIRPPENWEENTILLNSLTKSCVEQALVRLDAQGVSSSITHLRKYQDWLHRQPKSTSEESIELLVDQILHTSAAPCAKAMMKVLDNIVPICKGKIDALEVLMGDNTLYELYNYLNQVDRAPFFGFLGHYQPQQRILEIGAGTGGTTAKILSQTKYSTYTFTDISAAFFPAAKDRFQSYSSIVFKTLDITKDPLDQGFEAESFDLIIAANVLHATPVLHETLTNVRKLLHSRGKLLLEELCGDAKFTNFIVGVLPGWWAGDSDGRADEPYISPDRWDKALKATGFSGLDDVAFDATPPLHNLAFMLASSSLVPVSPLKRDITLLSDITSSEIAMQMQKQLRSRGYTVRIQGIDQSLPDEEDFIILLDTVSPFFNNLSTSKLSTFQSFLRELQRSHSGALWVTRSIQMDCEDPRFSPAVGVARTVRSEFGIDFATCEVDVLKYTGIGLVIDVFETFNGRFHGDDIYPEYEYAIREGIIHVGRIFPFSVQDELKRIQEADIDIKNSRLSLVLGTSGLVDSLTWTAYPGQQKQSLKDDEVEIKVDTTGVNLKDIMISLGILELPSTVMGLEAAGIVLRVGAQVRDLCPGDRVAAFGPGIFVTSTILPASRCIKIPDFLSLEDAATMPLAFATVLHGICDIGQLQKSQTILIHSASEGVGLAAIQISQMIGATIYATVSSEEKVEYLTTSLGIPRDHISNSCDSSFLDAIMMLTNGHGVDLVLNSLSGDLLQASCKCVARFGKLVNLATSTAINQGQLPISVFPPNMSYIAIDIIDYIESRPEESKRLLNTIMDLYTRGHIQPITPVKTFAANDVKQCFAYIQTGQNIGKLRLSFRSQDTPIQAISHSAMSFLADASYLLVGGLGGLGSGVARWMVEHGARHLAFLSRTADAKSNKDLFRELEDQGCSITAVKGSVSNLLDVQKAILSTSNLKGIFNMSMVLQDESLLKMTLDEWNLSTGPKIQGTWNLHEASLDMKLDFFLLFSSMGGILGIPGQANYAAANTFMDAFVQFRHRSQLPASVINIGAVQGIGHVADNPTILDNLKLLECARMSQKDLFNAIIVSISHGPGPKSHGDSCYANPAQFITGLRDTVGIFSNPNGNKMLLDSRLVAYFGSSAENAPTEKRTSADKLRYFVSSAASDSSILTEPTAAGFVATEIAKWVFDLLMKPVDDDSEIDVSRSLVDVGLDSLAAVEMRSWLKASLGLNISVLEIMAVPSLAAMGEHVVQELIRHVDGGKKK